ncbi:hypothetical protein [Actinomadura madurae]|uniref:hypothetical protein n=1 Tax=Actinomadura madurae TaxID=1993 RepID=UPI0020D1F835|nr:hypothetical protein [Actinomadura madurae]MCP9984222.1 hypothetical protein [Actinomadura madurae]MCQ0004227.1 hypothetical protein [Actinomadura madurae]MCQ0020419.1 hypothetical protein [Actinomadura madurae]
MIILSGVLVVVAIALLVAGIVAGNGDSAQVFGLDALVVIYISIAVSIVSALCLAIGVFLRRKELFGPGVPVAPARTTKKAKKDKRKKSTPPAPAKAAPSALEAAAPPAEPADDEVEVPVPPADVPDDALVFVVRGRKRYHLDTCRQLAGRETEELTYAEAREEGFSSCTACMPDTALAARAAASAPASSDAGRAAGARPAAATGPGAERSEGGLAGIARPAPSALSFDKPGSSDRTAEIPRPDEPEPDAPAPRPAGPTLTDIPVAGVVGSAGEAPTAAESAEPAAEDSGDRPTWERTAETESAPPDVTVDLGPAPFGAEPLGEPLGAEPLSAEPLDAPAAPRPRDADDEDPLDTGREPASPVSDRDNAAEEDEPATAHDPEPSASGEPEPEGEGPQVRILSGTKRYHRVDCALIEDIGDEADDLESLSRAEAKSRGCTPCLVCQPDREHARD